MIKVNCLLAFTAINWILVINKVNDQPLVYTRWSIIKGFTRKLKGIKVAHFLGIPYAQPPIGDLRFKKPRPLQPRNGYGADGRDEDKIFKAFDYGTACMQKISLILNFSHVPISEDCLYMNVYTPLDSLPQDSSTGSVKPLLPVSVHIHGSAFVYLSSADPLFYGGYLSAKANVVVVTFNYRLGLFGLMYGHDKLIPGNLALYDQRAALIWVRQNIAAFGGDPGQVTLSGHSSGATFASLHLFSTQSRYLFKSAAILSGTATSRSATDSRSAALAKTRKLVSKVGCSEANVDKSHYNEVTDDQLSQYEIDCLMAKDAYDLIEAQPDVNKEIFEWGEMCSLEIFLPFYGSPMFPESPDSMLSKGDFRRDISILVGRVPVESARGITQITWNVDVVRDRMRNEIKTVLKDNSTGNIERVLEYYFNDCKTGDIRQIAEAVFNLFNDICWHCPNLMLSSQWSKYNRVYLYSYTYKSNHLGDLDLAQLFGAYHTEDVSLIFGFPYSYCSHYSDSDRLVSSYMMNLWSNFLYTGTGDWPIVMKHYSVTLPFHQQITGIWNQKADKLDDKQYICRLLNY
uniref:Carboxylic ester hydrolase n=1 Tax=Tetranychus urticae TaxID=32264 RepID=T1JWX5_TETUR